MTRIKLCGLTRREDIETVNQILPEYIGFVFAKGSKRYVPLETASRLKKMLDPRIMAVGVFVGEEPRKVAELLEQGVIDLAQLHGGEDERYIQQLRRLTSKPVIKAFSMDSEKNILMAQNSTADYILLDSGKGGTGTVFDWELLKKINRPYFLAGGLNPKNAACAVENWKPFAVDTSSGIETDGRKDKEKMTAFVRAVRSAAGKEEKP